MAKLYMIILEILFFKIMSAGGRVLGITAMGDSLDQALDNAYEAVQKVRFDGAHYRTDIGRVEYSD